MVTFIVSGSYVEGIVTNALKATREIALEDVDFTSRNAVFHKRSFRKKYRLALGISLGIQS